MCVVEQIEDNDKQLAPLTGCITTQPRNKKYCARLSVNNAIVFYGGDVLHSSRVGQHKLILQNYIITQHWGSQPCVPKRDRVLMVNICFFILLESLRRINLHSEGIGFYTRPVVGILKFYRSLFRRNLLQQISRNMYHLR